MNVLKSYEGVETEQERKYREAGERGSCPACLAKRQHSDEEWKNHPRAATGVDRGA